MASEGRVEDLVRGGDGAPSVDAWNRCIVLVIPPCTKRLRELSIANVGGRS
jgi:1,6-anhydro-N-acetylmuramate kinase